MTQEYSAREYQHLITDHILEYARCAIWADMGLGKTVATLTALDMLIFAGYINGKMLVMAPLRVARMTWPEEVKKWAHLNHIRVSVITGTEKERLEALDTEADLYTINYENIQWLIEEILDRRKDEWPFEVIVSDEATKLKGFRLKQGTKRARALARVAHKYCDRFIELTGTCAPNGLKDVWGQIWFIDGGKRLGRTFTAFVQRWFQRSFNGFGLDALPHAQKEIEEKLGDICLSLQAKDYFDLDDPIENIIEVELPPNAREIYDDMEKRMYTEIEGEEIEAFNAAAKTMKCLQIANGAAYIEGGNKEWKVVHDEKIKALEEIIEESGGMPILVAYHFKSDLARLKKAFPKGRSLDKKPQTIRDWNAGKIPLMFTHPASAGHGLNLQDGGNIIVFFSINWNLEEHLQIIERIGPVRQKQAGYERPVFIHYIMARKTMDSLIKLRLESKRKVQDILIEALKKRKVES